MACLVLLQSGCGGSTPTAEQQVTDAINAYQSAVLAGDGETACGAVTSKFKRQLAGRDRNVSLDAACVHEVASLHEVPGFVKINKDVALTKVTVHGDKAQAQAKSRSQPVVTADYTLVKTRGDWKIDVVLGTS
jgi:hypothetical protein